MSDHITDSDPITTYTNGIQRARRAYAAKCPECEADVNITTKGRIRKHEDEVGMKCPGSGGLPR